MSHITKQFGNRMVVIKPESSVATLSAKEGQLNGCGNMGGAWVTSVCVIASLLKKRIFSEGRNDRIVLLDCDASFPYQLSGLNLHAIVVYIQINQKKILVKLVKEHCKDSAQREEQLQAAYQLYDLPPVSIAYCWYHHRLTLWFPSSIPPSPSIPPSLTLLSPPLSLAVSILLDINRHQSTRRISESRTIHRELLGLYTSTAMPPYSVTTAIVSMCILSFYFTVNVFILPFQ